MILPERVLGSASANLISSGLPMGPISLATRFLSSSCSSAVGFTLVMVLFAGLRERLALMAVPALFAGTPIAFITAGILSLAFMGFAGLNTK